MMDAEPEVDCSMQWTDGEAAIGEMLLCHDVPTVAK